MKTCDLQNVLESFITDNNKSILINGKWGCGKTYQISKFMKDAKEKHKEVPIYYLSAFGFKTIDELHTKLFSLISPKSKVLKLDHIISPAIALIPNCGNALLESLDRTSNSIEVNCKTNLYTNINNKNNKLKIVIIDDFERTEINLKDLLGYFNQLYLQNIKLICVGDLTKLEYKYKDIVANSNDKEENNSSINSLDYIDKENNQAIYSILQYKEKIFDREYRLIDSNEELIKEWFGETDTNVINKYIINLFEENLRNVKRASSLYKQAKEYIKSKSNKELIDLSYIAYYASLITKVDIDDSLVINFKQEIKKKYNDPNTPVLDNVPPNIEKDCIEKYTKMEYSKEEVDKLFYCMYSKNEFIEAKDYQFKQELISSLANIYFNNRYDRLDEFINMLSNIDNSSTPYQEYLFFLSTKHKQEVISYIVNDLKTKETLDKQELNSIINTFNYLDKGLFPNEFNLDEYIEYIAKLILKNNLYEEFDNARAFGNIKKEYYEKILDSYNSLLLDNIINNLKVFYNKDDSREFRDELDLIYPYENNLNGTITIQKSVINKLKENNWFINLSGDIIGNKWHIVHAVCSKFSEYKNAKEELKKYLLGLKTNNIVDEVNERVDQLVGQYLIVSR